MDHITLPSKASRPTWEVPLLSDSSYLLHKGPFDEFPRRFIRSRSVQDDVHETGDHVLARMVQTWLYFGVISEFFEEEVDLEDFSQEGALGKKILCSTALRRLRSSWVEARNLKSEASRDATFKKCLNVLIQATHACERLEETTLDIEGMDAILLSVRILLCTLAITSRAISKQSQDLKHLLSRLRLHRQGSSTAWQGRFSFLQHMISNGWW